MKACAVIVAVLMLALGVQSLRVAGLKTDLAVLQGDLDAANTRVALLEESEKALAKARDGLTGQVEACQRENARAVDRAASRSAIMRNARIAPAKAGQVVDDETSRRAASHINDAGR